MIETRMLVDFADIAGIEFACRKCAGSITYPFGQLHDRLSERCPNCDEPWFKDNPGQAQPGMAEKTKNVIAAMRALSQNHSILASVRLSINPGKETQKPSGQKALEDSERPSE